MKENWKVIKEFEIPRLSQDDRMLIILVDEFYCYRKLYGDLFFEVPHYQKRLGLK